MCFSLAWIASLLIWLVAVAAVVAILRLLTPWLTANLSLGGGFPLVQIINIVIWVVIAIFIIRLIFALLACADMRFP